MEDSGAASGEKGVILSLFLSTESKAKLYNICGTMNLKQPETRLFARFSAILVTNLLLVQSISIVKLFLLIVR